MNAPIVNGGRGEGRSVPRYGGVAQALHWATAILVLIGRISLLRAIPAAILGLAACWWFFHLMLGVQLPVGPW